MILTSVLLPAPFSPQMARTSWASSERLTFLRTAFGPNRLVTPATARTDIRFGTGSVRAAGSEFVEVGLGDPIHRDEFVLLQRRTVEKGGELLRSELGFLGRDLRRGA